MKGSTDVSALILLAVSISLAVAGQVLMKWGMSGGRVSEVGQLLRALVTVPVLSGLLCFVVSAALWLVVLSRLDLSYVYPMVAVAQVAIMLLSWLILRESLPMLRILGMAVICVGVVCVALSYGRPAPTASADPASASVQQE